MEGPPHYALHKHVVCHPQQEGGAWTNPSRVERGSEGPGSSGRQCPPVSSDRARYGPSPRREALLSCGEPPRCLLPETACKQEHCRAKIQSRRWHPHDHAGELLVLKPTLAPRLCCPKERGAKGAAQEVQPSTTRYHYKH